MNDRIQALAEVVQQVMGWGSIPANTYAHAYARARIRGTDYVRVHGVARATPEQQARIDTAYMLLFG